MKKVIIIILIIVLTVLVAFLIIKNSNLNKEKNNIENSDLYIKKSKESEKISMKLVIGDKEYFVSLEDNETVDSLAKMLPLELNMKELNGNEKYYYLAETLPSNPKNPGRIEKGDIMLYGNDCLVVFYKSFNTNYTYTKVGHVDNLPDLGKGNVKIKFIR